MARAKKAEMKVVYAASRNLYPYMLPSITSLLEHNKVAKIYLLIEDDELPYELPKECECINVSGQKWFPADSVNMKTQFTYLAMVRACYASLFPEEDKILQLDVDTIVCDSLQPLWETDLTGKYFAACEEVCGAHRPYGEPYYNIGVCLFNLEEIRKSGVETRVIEMLNKDKLPFIDQDAWNFFGIDNAVSLPSRYNECLMTGRSDNPAVVHFAGYPTWWVPQVMPGHEYLAKYRHLFK